MRTISNEAAAHASKANIRADATQFAARWRHATSEAAERQSFWNDFFAIFGIERRQVAAFERLATRASTGNRGWIDLLFPGQMGVEHKSAGEDLDAAMDQLVDYLPSLTAAEHPWLLVTCDFQRFSWQNLDNNESGEFPLAELPDHVELFWWLAGYDKPHLTYGTPEEANLVATELLAAVHDRLKDNGYPDHDLREWMTRILFVLFADDAGVWDRAAFHSYISLQTKPDGSDLGQTIALIFDVLDTPPEQRQRNLDEDLAAMTYVNGDLFARRLSIPACDKDTRDALLWASTFNWAAISPAIFGSLFQNVMEARERRQLGAHYTTEQNILRTIRPLFLDELEVMLAAARTKPKLRAFIDHLANLRFFDPACGCGNFLVIAYRELRRLETEAVRRLRDAERRSGQLIIDVTLELKLSVDQFYGLEIEEFPAKIARTAMYLADHLANRDVSAEFGQHVVRFPIPAAPHIEITNALRMDWSAFVPAEECSFVFGNPPYAGKHLLTADQRTDLDLVFGQAESTGALDYVAGWFRLAASYLREGEGRGAFVATNSITQGEQVPILWPLLHALGLHITFAWRTFEWRNEARGMAHVHVVIIGFQRSGAIEPGSVYMHIDADGNDPPPVKASSINGFLMDAPEVYPSARTSPLASRTPPVVYGSKPVDGGHLLLSEDEARNLKKTDPIAARFVRPLYSTTQFVNGQRRYCLWLDGAPPTEVRRSAELLRRLRAVQAFRKASVKASTQLLAQTPGVFGEIRVPTGDFIFVPIHVSGARRLIPMGFVSAKEKAIVHNSGAFIERADLALFGVLQSAWFTLWQALVGGRIKSDFRFNNRLVYNTFPFPELDATPRSRIADAASAVLDARTAHPGSSLADLYDPLAQPTDLVSAHGQLDRAVDAAFNRAKRKWTDAERLSLLLKLYAESQAGGELPMSSAPTVTRQPRAARR